MSAEVRAGILYCGIPLAPALSLLRETGTEVLDLWAVIGPAVFFGREDGPPAPYDVAVRDQNEDCPVSERAFPWNLGDIVWTSIRWQGMTGAARFSKMSAGEEAWFAFALSTHAGDMEGVTAAWARREGGPHHHQLPPKAWRPPATAPGAGLRLPR